MQSPDNQSELERMAAAFYDRLQPVDRVERELVNEMIACQWYLRTNPADHAQRSGYLLALQALKLVRELAPTDPAPRTPALVTPIDSRRRCA